MQYKIKKNKIYEKTTLSKIIYPKSLRTGPFGSNLKVSDYVKNSNYKVYTQENIICNDINIGDKYITEKKYNDLKSSKIENGDFLVSTRGTLGRFMYADNIPSEGVIHSSVIKFRVNYDLVEWKFILLQLKYLSICKNFILESTNVGAIPALYTKNILDIPIYLTDIIQQKKIINILEKQEYVISNIEKLISKTEKMFEYFCDREFDLKDIEKNNYQIKDIIIRNPKSTIKAGDIKESTGNIPAFNSSAKLQYFYDDYLVDGENIFLPTGGNASIHYNNGKSAYTTDVFSFKTEEEKVLNKYMYFYFKNDLSILDKMFYGAGLKHLNKNELFNYEISIPSLEKQKETVELLEKQERLIENQKKLLEKEKQKFEWLSEKLLSGEYLVVEEQE